MFKIDKILSQKIINITRLARCNSLHISGKNYFVKKDENLKEYLGCKLAELVGLKCIEYNVIVVNGFFYVISRDINETTSFIPATTFTDAYHELYLIINDLNKLPFTTTNTIQDFLKMYLYDILFLNGDRHYRNWGLVKIDNEYRVIIFDNENIFSLFLPYIRFNSTIFSNQSKSYSSRICEDFEAFLKICPREYLSELYSMIDKAEIENVAAIIKNLEIEFETQLDPSFLQTYTSSYNKIKAIVSKHKAENRTR